MKGISVSKARLTERGFEKDRRFMLVDDHGTFLSQRTHKKLSLYKTSFSENDTIIISSPTGATLSIDSSAVTDEQIRTNMWGHSFPVHKLNKEVTTWWSKELGQSVHMTCQLSSDVRIKKYWEESQRTEVSLADGYPYLIVGTASLNHLNASLATPLKADRYRANIIIETNVPHEEDNWGEISIGTGKLSIVKPCARCEVITIDQQTATAGKEPLTTLSKYRKVGHSINFGANAVAVENARISVGDKVLV